MFIQLVCGSVKARRGSPCNESVRLAVVLIQSCHRTSDGVAMQTHSRNLRGLLALALTLALTPAWPSVTQAATAWTEGKHYFLITPPRTPSVPPGKVEVTEVFSYGCPACNLFVPIMHKLQKSLPP